MVAESSWITLPGSRRRSARTRLARAVCDRWSFQLRAARIAGSRLLYPSPKYALWFGVGGVGALVFLVVLMWMVVHNEDVLNAPVPVDPQSRKEELDTSKSDKATESAKPEKPPPLDQ